MIGRVSGQFPVGTAKERQTTQPAGSAASFGALFSQEAAKAGLGGQTAPQQNEVEFSKHARQRAEERGIEVTGDLVEQLADSIGRAQVKGAKNILVFDAGRAFIVNVEQNRVVTTMSQDEMKENVFTNIDGAVLLK